MAKSKLFKKGVKIKKGTALHKKLVANLKKARAAKKRMLLAVKANEVIRIAPATLPAPQFGPVVQRIREERDRLTTAIEVLEGLGIS